MTAAKARSGLYPPIFRVLAGMRYVLLALTLLVNFSRLDEATRPVGLLVIGGVMTAASVAAHLAYSRVERRRDLVLILDIGLTLALTFASVWVLPPGESLPATGFWVTAAPVAMAVSRGWGFGMAAAFSIVLTDFLLEPRDEIDVVGLWISYVIGIGSLGFMVDQVREATLERERLYANAAANAERQRLARIVHDGVLQVLALMEREGPRLGDRGVRLAALASEQESRLRAMIRDPDPDPAAADPSRSNLVALLDRHSSARVMVSTPAEPVLMDAVRAAELEAAVTEALTNVSKHAGVDARAWILLEAEGDDVTVSIRDNGVGAEEGQLRAALESGRMGMRYSIQGRIRDLGGRATLRTAPGRGVEWEFRLPLGE